MFIRICLLRRVLEPSTCELVSTPYYLLAFLQGSLLKMKTRFLWRWECHCLYIFSGEKIKRELSLNFGRKFYNLWMKCARLTDNPGLDRYKIRTQPWAYNRLKGGQRLIHFSHQSFFFLELIWRGTRNKRIRRQIIKIRKKTRLTERYFCIKFLDFIGVKINAHQSVFDIGAKRVENGTFHKWTMYLL